MTDEQTRNREAELEHREAQRLEQERAGELKKEADITAIAELLENKFQRADDFVHKENVKVYRNVQAVVVDEIKRSTENAQNDKNELKKELEAKLNKVMVCSILSMAASAVSVILWALVAAGIIK